MQPSVTYKPTSNQEYNVFWNFTEGTVVNPGGPQQPLPDGFKARLGQLVRCDLFPRRLQDVVMRANR